MYHPGAHRTSGENAPAPPPAPPAAPAMPCAALSPARCVLSSLARKGLALRSRSASVASVFSCCASAGRPVALQGMPRYQAGVCRGCSAAGACRFPCQLLQRQTTAATHAGDGLQASMICGGQGLLHNGSPVLNEANGRIQLLPQPVHAQQRLMPLLVFGRQLLQPAAEQQGERSALACAVWSPLG